MDSAEEAGASEGQGGVERAKRVKIDAQETFWDDSAQQESVARRPEVRVDNVSVETLITIVSTLKPECASGKGSATVPLRVYQKTSVFPESNVFGVGVPFRDAPDAPDVHATFTTPSAGIDMWATMDSNTGFSFFRMPCESVTGLQDGETREVCVSASAFLRYLKTYQEKGVVTLVFAGDASRDTIYFESMTEGEEISARLFGMVDGGGCLHDMIMAHTPKCAPDIVIRMSGPSFTRKLDALDVEGASSRIELHRLVVGGQRKARSAEHLGGTQKIGFYFVAQNQTDCELVDGFSRVVTADALAQSFDFRAMAPVARKQKAKAAKAEVEAPDDQAEYDVDAAMKEAAEDETTRKKERMLRGTHDTFARYRNDYLAEVDAGRVVKGEPMELPNRLFPESYTLLMDMPLRTKELSQMFKKMNRSLDPGGLTLLVSTKSDMPLFVVASTTDTVSLHVKMPMVDDDV